MNNQKILYKFIKTNDKVNWAQISIYKNLSENFIREFQNKVNWDSISAHQKLSEPFIREFQDTLNWDYIPYHQNLSKKFKSEFKHKIKLSIIKKYCINSFKLIM